MLTFLPQPGRVDHAAIRREFMALRPSGGFKLIYADPAWCWEAFSADGLEKSPEAQYVTMTDEDILRMPVPVLAAQNCVLALWATFPKLPLALDVMHAWGFEYRTGGAWGKTTKDGKGLAFGTGYILRSASELLLIGVKGAPRAQSKSVRNCWMTEVDGLFWAASRREHSRKPDQVRADLEALFPAPRIELFARTRAEGWAAWGNQVDKFAGEPLAVAE